MRCVTGSRRLGLDTKRKSPSCGEAGNAHRGRGGDFEGPSYLERAGSEPDAGELVLGGTPYLTFYRERIRRVMIAMILPPCAVERLRPLAEKHQAG